MENGFVCLEGNQIFFTFHIFSVGGWNKEARDKHGDKFHWLVLVVFIINNTIIGLLA